MRSLTGQIWHGGELVLKHIGNLSSAILRDVVCVWKTSRLASKILVDCELFSVQASSCLLVRFRDIESPRTNVGIFERLVWSSIAEHPAHAYSFLNLHIYLSQGRHLRCLLNGIADQVEVVVNKHDDVTFW